MQHWIPEEKETLLPVPTCRWWWILIGTLLAIVFLSLYETYDPVISEIRAKFCHLNDLYRGSQLFEVPVTDHHREQTHCLD
jgi:hypothetical protein